MQFNRVTVISDSEVALENLATASQRSWFYSTIFLVIVVTAKHLKGREEIFKYHDELRKGLFKDSQRGQSA